MSSLYLTKVVPNSVVLRPPNPLESTIDLTPGPGREKCDQWFLRSKDDI